MSHVFQEAHVHLLPQELGTVEMYDTVDLTHGWELARQNYKENSYIILQYMLLESTEFLVGNKKLPYYINMCIAFYL